MATKYWYLALLGLLFFITPLARAKTKKISQLYLAPQPLYHSLAHYHGVWRTAVIEQKGNNKLAVQAVGMYQRSHDHHDAHRTGAYFLPNGHDTITIASDAANVDRAVRADWFGLTDATDMYTLHLHPHETQTGALISINKNLNNATPWEIFNNWWLEATIPIVQVKRSLGIKSTSETTDANNIITAISSRPLKAGLFYTGKDKKTGVPCVELWAGSTYRGPADLALTYAFAFDIATEARLNNRKIFQSNLGTRHHHAMVTLFSIDLPLTESNMGSANFYAVLYNRFYLSNTQWRTFDLRHKPWSRYLLVQKNGDTEQPIPAANVLTQKVKVHPGSFADISSGFTFKSSGFQAEIGYNLWAHKTERIVFLHPKTEHKHHTYKQYGIAGSTNTTTASDSTIKKLAANDDDFVTIKDTDIDLRSGAYRGGMTHGIHGAVYYRPTETCSHFFAGVGGAYHHAHTNASLSSWSVWGKIGCEL